MLRREDEITLVCVWLRGAEKRRAYSAEYVRDLQRHVFDHTSRPFRMVCLTNVPHSELPTGCEGRSIPWPRDGRNRKARGWWGKVQLFNPIHEIAPLGSRVLYLDLDAFPVDSLEPIINYPSAFAICPDMAPTFNGRGMRRTIHRYNSSVMAWDYGQGTEIWSQFTPSAPQHLWGDQDWIALCLPVLDIMPQEWFTRLQPTPWTTEPRVVLCNKWKPHIAREKWPWFAERWSARKSAKNTTVPCEVTPPRG